MSGIRVSFDLTFSNKAWVEAERYRFLEFVSSQSTMHRITKFDLEKQYNKYVDKEIIKIMKNKVDGYNRLVKLIENIRKTRELSKEEDETIAKELKELYLEILYSNPAGFMLRQRKDHRLPEWREFCKWIETLPYAKELICYEV